MVHEITSNTIAIVGGRTLTPFRFIEDGIVIITDGIITAVGPRDEITIPQSAHVVDATGHFVAPGFIETHVHGGGGGDVMSGDPTEIIACATAHARGGVTAMLPTTVTAPLDATIRALEAIEQAMDKPYQGAAIIGAHLEGPYLNRAQAGAQNPEFLTDPDIDQLIALLERFPWIKRVSVAPELPGGLEMGRELKRRGIIASIAHSDATYQQIVRAVENGYTHATHMYSGMSQMTRSDGYRIAGVIEAVLSIEELSTEFIADGHHIPPSMLRMALNAKGVQQICLTTDATRKAGTGPGPDELFGLATIVEDDKSPMFELLTVPGENVAKLRDRSAFAGSVATMDQLIRTMISPHVGVSLPDAIKMATTVPARIHGLSHERGVLSIGMTGDAVIFDEHIDVKQTIVQGEIVYDKKMEAMKH